MLNAPVTEDMFDVTLFDPADLRIFHAPDGDTRVRVQVRDEVTWLAVRMSRTLPLSNPDEYLALRDGKDKDIGVIKDWHALDASSLAVVQNALEDAYRLPKVTKVTKVVDLRGVVEWEVITDHGPRRYMVRNLRDSSVALSSKRVIMTDVSGERFEFDDIHQYGHKALDILQKVL